MCKSLRKTFGMRQHSVSVALILILHFILGSSFYRGPLEHRNSLIQLLDTLVPSVKALPKKRDSRCASIYLLGMKQP